MPRMVQRRWFPEALTGSRVVLRRHAPGNIAAFLRWYADPEIARLARRIGHGKTRKSTDA